MNITFIIGNGFDLNLGLKTKFTDFYDTYFKAELDRDVPDSVKKFIDFYLKEKEITGNIENWSDFEMAFAENVQGTVEEVSEILEDFTIQFAEYLRKEEEAFKGLNLKQTYEFLDFLCISHNFLKMRDKQLYSDLLRKNIVRNPPNSNPNITFKVRCINFNYTSMFDTIYTNTQSFMSLNHPEFLGPERTKCEYIFNSPVLHIHGDLKSNIVLGIDSTSQLVHSIIGSEDELKDTVVKKAINYYANSSRETAFSSIIDKSNAVFMYGLSLGETDKSRWEIIKEWLKKNTNNKLIYFSYQTNINQIRPEYAPRVMSEIKRIKGSVLIKLGFEDSEIKDYYDQVFIIDSSDVLNFKLNDENKEPEVNMN